MNLGALLLPDAVVPPVLLWVVWEHLAEGSLVGAGLVRQAVMAPGPSDLTCCPRSSSPAR